MKRLFPLFPLFLGMLAAGLTSADVSAIEAIPAPIAAPAAKPTVLMTSREAPEDTAIYVLDPTLKTVPGFKLLGKGPRILIESQGEGLGYSAIIEGNFMHPDASLLWKSDTIGVDSKGNFSVTVPILTQATRVEFFAVDAFGGLEKQEVKILITNWEAFKKESLSKPPKPNFFNVGAGLSMISLADSRVATFNELGITAKAGYARMLFPPRWDAGATAFVTLLPFAANRNDSVRFLGLNARIGYVVPRIQEPWRVSIQGGFYYTTMFVSSNTFGFSGMMGPQLFPTVRRLFRNGSSASAYVKFSPVAGDLSLISLSNHELAAGVAYAKPISGGHSIGVSLDVAQLHVTISPVEITSTSYTLGANYGF